MSGPDELPDDLTEEERRAVERQGAYLEWERRREQPERADQ